MLKAYLYLFLVSLCLCGANVLAQKDSIKLSTEFKVKPNFHHSFFDTLKWDYNWWVIPHDDHFESTFGELTSEDTIHQIHTAQCVLNHQGEHKMRYCDATLLEDGTIQLSFVDGQPAYSGHLTIFIRKNKFDCSFKAYYVYTIKDQNLSWTFLEQDLILDQSNYKLGDTIKGEINLKFREDFSAPEHESTSKEFYFNGVFKTPLLQQKD